MAFRAALRNSARQRLFDVNNIVKRVAVLTAYKGPYGTAQSYPYTRYGPPTATYCTSVGDDRIIRSPRPDVPIPEMPLHDYIQENFHQYPDELALLLICLDIGCILVHGLVDGISDRSYSYGELQDKIKRVASALSRRGIKRGDVILIHSYNIPEYAIVILAASTMGVTYCTINPLYTQDEMYSLADLVNATLFVTVPPLVNLAQSVKEKCPRVKDIIVMDGDVPGYTSLTQLFQDDGDALPRILDINLSDDVAAIFFSSGTTGLPKAVMHPHMTFIHLLQENMDTEERAIIPGQSTWVVYLPFFHGYGQVLCLLLALRLGIKVVTLPKFDIDLYLDAVQKYKATMLHLVPPILTMMAKLPGIEKYDFTNVRSAFTVAAPIGEGTLTEFMNKTKVPIRQAYGMTECGITHLTQTGCKYLASVGQLTPNTECKVISTETGEPLPANQTGEILIRGGQVMLGYFNNKRATDETIDSDGWLHTGDIGYYNDEQYFFIVDRLKELIKYKAMQVAPAELEDLLRTHPDIQAAAVIGVPDERAGEIPRAYVVRKPGSTVTEEDIVGFVKERKSNEKRLRGGVVFIDAIPTLPSGKILRRELREMAKME